MASTTNNDQDMVLVDGSVVMRIVKHCREHRPQFVSGQLLGLDYDNVLQVTNSFPFQSKLGDDDEDNEKFASEGAAYISTMLNCLEEIKMDRNVVGWYSSNYMGKFFNDDSLGTQFDYQQRSPKSVVFLFDPIKTTQGSLSLKAYRLTDAFMNLYKTKQFTKESLAKSGISFDDIYVEVPLKITNLSLVNAFLLELEESGNNGLDVDRFDFSQTNPYLEKTLETLIDTLDDLSAEHLKFQFYQKNVQRQAAMQSKWLQNKKEGDENAPKAVVEPSRLDSLVYTNQIDNYCQQIKQFSGNNFAKLWLLGGVSKDV